MRLINTIEINPYNFVGPEYEWPDGSQIESPEERDQFWIKCISEKNLGGLLAIRKGSYLVDITTINDAELEEILRNVLKEVELEEFEDQVICLSGGIVLEENDIIYVEPTCCGDIGTTNEWECILDDMSAKWKQLWIGHPWVYYRSNQGMIEFSDYTESNSEDLSDVKIMIGVHEADMKKEVERIRSQQNDFEHRIKTVLEKMGIENAMQISKLMTGNV